MSKFVGTDPQTISSLVASGSTNAVGSTILNLKECEDFSVQVKLTDSTPAAKAFVDADVNVVNNTIAETAHGFVTGLKVRLTSTGTLPAGLALSTDYFVIATSADLYKLADTYAHALAGSAVDITAAAGGGTHTTTAVVLAGVTAVLTYSNDGVNFVTVSGASLSLTAADPNGLIIDSKPSVAYARLAVYLTAGMATLVVTPCVKV